MIRRVQVKSVGLIADRVPESMFWGSSGSLKDRIIQRTFGQRHRSIDVSIAGAEQEFASGPDDPRLIGVTRWTILPVLRQQFENLTATLVCE